MCILELCTVNSESSLRDNLNPSVYSPGKSKMGLPGTWIYIMGKLISGEKTNKEKERPNCQRHFLEFP